MPSWKKIIVSGSNAELNQLTATSFGGNISGSSTSTGSFGSGFFDGRVGIYQKTPTAELHISSPSSQPGIRVDGTYANIQIEGDNLAHISLKDEGATSGERVYQIVSDGGILNFNRTNDAISSVTATPLKLKDDKVEVLNISGSSTSTGSFGHLMVGGGNFTSASLASAVAAGDSSFTAAGISGSLGANATFIRDLTAAKVSGSFTAGTGLDLSSGQFSVDVSDFMTNGSDNRIVTATGADAQNAEANLTFDGSTLNVTGKIISTDDIQTSGDVIANRYVVSSSVSVITSSFSSGSTIFGDDSDDTHKFTGSLQISGGLEVQNGNLEVAGNISGSSTSTGSFGNLFTDNNADVQGQLFIQPQNNTNNSTTAEELVIYGASTEAGLAIVANADSNNYYTSYIKARFDGAEGFYIKGPSGDKFLSYGHSGTNTRIGVSDTAGTLHLRAKTISGSSVSTGSFGRVEASTIAGNSPLTIDTDIQFSDDTDISGSATSTGSFGHITTPGGIDAVGPFTFQTTAAANDTVFRTAGTSGYALILKNSDNSARMYFQTNTGVTNIIMDGNNQSNLLKLSADGLTETRGQVGSAHADGNLELYSNNGLNNLILSASMTTISGSGDTTLDVKGNIFSEGNISGSATSTGSFGRLQTADTVASFGSHTFTLGGNVTTGGTLTTAGNFTTQNNDVTINAVGAGRTLTLNESLTVGDGNDGTITFSGASKTLTVEDNATVDQDLSSDANVTFGSLTTTNNVTVGGDLIVNGTTTTLATSNLEVQDAFGFFATGSAGTNVDAGIIVQSGSAVDSGSALFHDISKERWSVAKGVASTASTITNAQWGGFVATVYTGSASPVGNDPQYGVGEIHIDADGEIYIYS